MSMNYRSIARVIGTLFLVTAGSMLLPVLVCLFYEGENDLSSILISIAITVGLGAPLFLLFRNNTDLHIRDAFVIATFGWIFISAVSALPFMIHGSIPSFTDAFFEMMSGYTTTGATILTDIEALPHGLLFWRSETHLLGGMGFLTLTIFFLPQGMGGLRIFRAESSPGQVITKDKFTPRNKDAMMYLWIIYLTLNVLQILFLCAGGMSLFDSLCHAFGTVSTSGYSTYNASIAYYNNAYFDWVFCIFMFLGGLPFLIYYHLVRAEWRIFKGNTELTWYLGFVVCFSLTIAWILWKEETYGLVDSLRYSTFQVLSLLTTTGFTTADYELWPYAAQMFLFAVCFIGPCAGSTGSGIKVVHYVIIWKFMVGAVKKMFFQPLAVFSVRVNEHPIDQSTINLAVCYFILNIFFVLGGGCFMVLVDDMDYLSGMSSVIATLMNIGPGFGEIGPTDNFAHISAVGKWFLSFNMLVGRLEMFSVLVLFYPSFWRK